jgi:hypothetical protein
LALILSQTDSQQALCVDRTSVTNALRCRLLIEASEVAAADATGLPLLGLEIACIHTEGECFGMLRQGLSISYAV